MGIRNSYYVQSKNVFKVETKWELEIANTPNQFKDWLCVIELKVWFCRIRVAPNNSNQRSK